MNEEDWCELTENFHPVEHMEDVLKVLGKLRVFSSDDDRLYLFTTPQLDIKHAAYRLGARWICPCPYARPCPAVAVMQVASFGWTIDDDPREQTHESRDD